MIAVTMARATAWSPPERGVQAKGFGALRVHSLCVCYVFLFYTSLRCLRACCSLGERHRPWAPSHSSTCTSSLCCEPHSGGGCLWCGVRLVHQTWSQCPPVRLSPLGLSSRVRMCRILPDLDPRLREMIQTQEFFQDLESWEPILDQMPLRASEIFRFQGAKSPNP